MYEFKTCRICLVIDGRMFKSQGFFGYCLNELLEHKIVNSADFPPYICYECAYLLKKCIKFKEKCLLGQNVLLDILQRNKQITKKNISFVDRIKLVSTLEITPIPAKCYFSFEDTADCDDNIEDIKQENIPNIEVEPGTSHDLEPIYNEHTFFVENYDHESFPEGNKYPNSHQSVVQSYSFGVNKSHEGDGDSEEKTFIDDYNDNGSSPKENEELSHSLDGNNSFDDNNLQKSETHTENNYDIFIKAKEDCVICRRKLNTFESVKVRLPRAIEKLKKFSLLRNDGLFPLFNSVQEVHLHTNCRSVYTIIRKSGNYAPLKPEYFLPKVKKQKKKKLVEQKILKGTKKKQPLSLPSSQDADIDYRTHCFICLKNTTIKTKLPKNERKKHQTITVNKPTTKDTVIKYLLKWKDSQSYPNVDENIKRIKDLDLVNIPGRYHRNCFLRLRFCRATKDGLRGRPEVSEIKEAMDLIYSYMEEMYDGSGFTFEELSGILPGYVPSKKTILRKLKNHFRERIEITSETGKSTVFMLKY